MIGLDTNWGAVELRHLAAFRAVARSGSFWDAGELLDSSQSTISQQVAALEGHVGERLLERSRGRRGVALTEAGRLLLVHAESIMARLNAARADIEALAVGEAGQLRVGALQSVANRILPDLMRVFAETLPGVSVELLESGQVEHLLDMVEAGGLDVALVNHPVRDGPFDVVELMKDPWMLMAPRDSDLARQDGPIRLSDIAGAGLVSYYTLPPTLSSQLISRGCRVVVRSDDNNTIQRMVGAGVGIAIAPRLAVDERDPAVVVRELGWQVAPRLLVLCIHRNRYRSKAFETFVDLARRASREVERSDDSE
jgi:DNA-binding transcriptional LysR family regulator